MLDRHHQEVRLVAALSKLEVLRAEAGLRARTFKVGAHHVPVQRQLGEHALAAQEHIVEQGLGPLVRRSRRAEFELVGQQPRVGANLGHEPLVMAARDNPVEHDVKRRKQQQLADHDDDTKASRQCVDYSRHSVRTTRIPGSAATSECQAKEIACACSRIAFNRSVRDLTSSGRGRPCCRDSDSSRRS